jgi:hypothetical protein
MQTQVERLEKYLQEHKKINPLQSWRNLGIYRLSAVILKLRKRGLSITTKRIDVPNQFGEFCNVAEYQLEESC